MTISTRKIGANITSPVLCYCRAWTVNTAARKEHSTNRKWSCLLLFVLRPVITWRLLSAALEQTRLGASLTAWRTGKVIFFYVIYERSSEWISHAIWRHCLEWLALNNIGWGGFSDQRWGLGLEVLWGLSLYCGRRKLFYPWVIFCWPYVIPFWSIVQREYVMPSGSIFLSYAIWRYALK